MPRPRRCTDDEVLDAAIALFWRQAFSATSMRDLARATGLGAAALYHRFVPHKRQQQDLDDFPHLKRWFETIREREAVARAYGRAKAVNQQPTVSEQSRAVLFGQNAGTVR